MDFSLVIGTRNRAEKLEKCLAAVARLCSSADWELVIVDNASTDRTAAVIEDFKRHAPMPVVAVFEAKAGLGRARNRGLSTAHGNIVGFTDDDCYPAPDYVDRILEIFCDREIGYAGGRIKLFDLHDWPISIVDKAEARIIEPFTYIDGPEMKILGANMAFRRKVLMQIGGFDDALGAGGLFSCEDVDAFARASFAGWKGGYFPDPTVLHDHGRSEESARRLARSYAIARGAYFAKFILRRDSARLYAKEWICRSARECLVRPRDVLQEIGGACAYLWVIGWRRVANNAAIFSRPAGTTAGAAGGDIAAPARVPTASPAPPSPRPRTKLRRVPGKARPLGRRAGL
jgi:glycosyltransferase involved in cell wall biosynthesis